MGLLLIFQDMLAADADDRDVTQRGDWAGGRHPDGLIFCGVLGPDRVVAWRHPAE